MRNDSLRVMNEIIEALKCSGYDPYEQLTGYLQTGNDFYITRKNGARDKIKSLDRKEIQSLVDRIRNIG